jgi:hypothetical protein
MPEQTAPNRQERRREARHKEEVAKGKIVNQAAEARRDRQYNAREINRMNIRHKFGIPDEPTTFEQVRLAALKIYEDIGSAWYDFWKLDGEEDSEGATNVMVGLLIAALAAILLCWYDRYEVGKTVSPVTTFNISHIPSGLYEE